MILRREIISNSDKYQGMRSKWKKRKDRRLISKNVNYPETGYMESLEQQEERRNFRGRNSRSEVLNQLGKTMANLNFVFKYHTRKRTVQVLKYTIYHRCHTMMIQMTEKLQLKYINVNILLFEI